MRKLFIVMGILFTLMTVTSIHTSAQEIYGCVSKRDGKLRIVSDLRQCNAKRETSIAWNQVGPQGEKGDKGDPGNQGPKGADGLSCWDLNENQVCDVITEDINGDLVCNALDCQGEPNGRFGEWQGGFLEETSYLAETDGLVVCYSSWVAGRPEIRIKTDSNDPPEITRVHQVYDGATAAYGVVAVTCPVRKGDYWIVTKNSGGHPMFLFIYWLPIGD